MPNKIKVQLGGEEVWGEMIPVQGTHECWNEYILADGSTLKLKPVLTDVLKIDGKYDAEGNPVYFLKTANVISVNAPEELRKKG